MRRLVMLALVALLLVPWAQACERAEAEPGRGVKKVEAIGQLQVGDSVKVLIRWTIQPLQSRQAPILRFNVRLRQGTGTILATGTAVAAARSDTLALMAPALGVTITGLYADVQTVDTLNATSAWASSATFSVKVTALPPSAPDSVRADTIPAQMASVDVRPAIGNLMPGLTKQFCAIGRLTDGASGVIGWETLDLTARIICDAEYQRWLTERAG